MIATYAGGGAPGAIAEGLAARAAGFTFPANSHIVYVADCGTNRVRKISTALNAQFSSPSDVAVDSQGNLYVADFGRTRSARFTASTRVITTILRGGFGPCAASPVAAAGEDIRAASIAVGGATEISTSAMKRPTGS